MLGRLVKFGRIDSAPRPIQTKHGFTLVELIVVISIISLTTAITLPAISNIRKTMRDMQCLARMRGLDFATSMYRNDHNNRFPQPTENTALMASKNGNYDDHTVASILWFNAVDPYLGLEP